MNEFIGGLAVGLVLGVIAGLAWMVHVFKGYDKHWQKKVSEAEAKAYRQGEQDAWVQASKRLKVVKS